MQSSSSVQPFKLVLAGASPAAEASSKTEGRNPKPERNLKIEIRITGNPFAACALDFELRPSDFEFRIFDQDRGIISSISPCEGDGPGANPGFLTRWLCAWLAAKYILLPLVR